MKRTVSLFLLSAGLLLGAGELSHRRAPGFSLMDAVQQQHDLYDYHGKYVIVDFMQSGCPHCITFAGIIEKVMAKYRPNLAALSVVVPPDTLATITKYVKEHNITIPVLFDCGQVTASYLRVGPQNPRVQFPHVFLVDPNGMIANDWVYGPGTENIFEGDGFIKEIDRVFAGKK